MTQTGEKLRPGGTEMPMAFRLAENPKEIESGKAGVLRGKTSEPTVAGSLEDFCLARP